MVWLAVSIGVAVIVAETDVGLAQVPAQSTICQPPTPGEYLVLVVSQTSQTQAQVKQLLPTSINTTVCTYLNDVVTRASGFTNAETADSWAQYLTQMAGLAAFVVQSPDTAQPAAPQPSTPTTSPALAYNPQPLGEGYAVLVNYLNQPDLATQVQQVIGQTVGLAVYQQRPYLLAIYTANQQDVSMVVQTLNARGFSSMVVDSRQVLLLKSPVSGQ
ncbi:MAG: hypothetical protein KME16_07670 [Scytolyngbya sp. HA4215-MV1]|nr:hypothetical protein [Scytolyngbya sp. HA4215-MV1]